MGSKQILALELGSTAFKLVLAEKKETQFTILQARVLELPIAADEPDRLKALQQLMTGVRLSDVKQVVSVISDPFYCLAQVQTPPMPIAELPEAVRWELQRYLAFPPEEAIVDVKPLGVLQVEGSKKLKVLAAAIPAQTVEKHLQFLAQAGIKPQQIIPKAQGVATWIHQSGEWTSSEPVAVLCIGGRSSEFLVVRQGEIVFARKIPMAGEEITRGMTTVLVTPQGPVGLTQAEAERLKRHMGIPSENSEEERIRGISSTQLLSLVRSSLEGLTTEVERSLAFYGESTEGTGVDTLMLVGGGAHLKGLAEWLSERLSMKVLIPRVVGPGTPMVLPTAEIQVPLSLVSTLGAALGAGEGLNLLPSRIKQAVSLQVKRGVFTGIITATVLGVVLIRIGLLIGQTNLEKQISALQVELASLTPRLPRAQSTLAIQSWIAQEPRWEEIFKELTHLVPPEVYLTSIALEGRLVTLRGRVQKKGPSSDAALVGFMQSLGKGFFSQTRLVSTRKLNDPPEEEFELQCRLR